MWLTQVMARRSSSVVVTAKAAQAVAGAWPSIAPITGVVGGITGTISRNEGTEFSVPSSSGEKYEQVKRR